MAGKYTVLVAGSEVDLWESIDFDNSLDLSVNKAAIQFPDSSSLLAAEGIGKDIQIQRDGVGIWRGLGISNQKIYDSNGKKQYNLNCLSNKVYLQNTIYSIISNSQPIYVVNYGAVVSSTSAPATNPLSTKATDIFSSILSSQSGIINESLSAGLVGTTQIPHAVLQIARQNCLAVLGQLIAGTLWEARFNVDNSVDFGTNASSTYPGTVGSKTSVFTFQEGENLIKTEVDYGIDKLINQVIVCGKGSASGNQVTYTASNTSSILQYGTFAKIVTLSNCADPNLLNAYANALLADLVTPIYTASTQLADLSTGVPFRMGDYVTVNNASFNLNGALFRVISEHRRYDAQQGEVVDVVLAQNYRMVDVHHFKRKALEGVLNSQLQNQQTFNNTFDPAAVQLPNPPVIFAPNPPTVESSPDATVSTYAALTASGISNGSTVTGFSAQAGQSSGTQFPPVMNTIVPWYFNVDADSADFTTLANAFSNTSGGANITSKIAVVSGGGSGPGTAYDANMVTQIVKIQGGGGSAIGYIYTDYGGRSLTDVENDVHNWFLWYGPYLKGIFIDEFANAANSTTELYYQQLYSYIYGQAAIYDSAVSLVVVGNMGATSSTSSAYFSPRTADVFCIYEGVGIPSASTIQTSLANLGTSDPQDAAILCYGVSTLPSNFTTQVANLAPYCGYMFVNDGPSPPSNTWGDTTSGTSDPTYLVTEFGTFGNGSGGAGSSNEGIMGFVKWLTVYPGTNTMWSTLISEKNADPAVKMYAIINPSSGPGTTPDSNYQTWVGKLQTAGIGVLGLIYTDYGVLNGPATGYSIADIEALIDSYYSFYGVDGILFGQMDTTNNSTNAAYYSTLTTYVHGKPTNSVTNLSPISFGDPGAIAPAVYIGTLDVILQYFTSEPTAATVQADTTTLGGTDTAWGIEAVNVSTVPSTTYIQSIDTYCQWMFFTDQSARNSATSPSYESTEISNMVVAVAAGPAYISRMQIIDVTNSNAVLYDSGAGNYGTSKTVSPTITSDIIDHVIQFYVFVTGNGTNPALASITNAFINLGITVPT